MSEETEEQTYSGASDAGWVALYFLALLLFVSWVVSPSY
jgi:hypothetical protein